jgi:hypothetical protein
MADKVNLRVDKLKVIEGAGAGKVLVADADGTLMGNQNAKR